MSSTPNVPLDVVETIIDILAEDDTNFLSVKASSLCCRAVLPFCRKHIYASIDLNHSRTMQPPSPTTSMLEQLLLANPELADYIRKLDYRIIAEDFERPTLHSALRLITRLQSLLIWPIYLNRGYMFWNNSLRPALLHLLHLPTLVHLSLLSIRQFAVSDLTPCVNLKTLKMLNTTTVDAAENFSSALPLKSIRLENLIVMDVGDSALELNKTRRSDGQFVIDLSDLVSVEVHLRQSQGLETAQELFKRCGSLTSVCIYVSQPMTLTGLSRLLEPCMQTLRRLHVGINSDGFRDDLLFDLPSELDGMKHRNVIESITVHFTGAENCREGDWGWLDQELTSPGWSSLKQVYLSVDFEDYRQNFTELERTLLKLREEEFPRLTLSKDIQFDFEYSFNT
ncbi:hypothetical protein GALMADRAFT_267571 [Galerina marginata CBS 339.88]|uniref:F-box domain-containing protein n=1 Tax=Galerina marginata (strain CBS 339.88) TaxID=685588 RepID=A0A067T2G8_GALM3|nr:hypothetical protein GALMADRAFT_267571 [Galerina marginata CBS 339.88]